MRQPTVAQRRQHSTAIPFAMTNGTPTMNTVDINAFRTESKPQPKPRLSLVKPNQKDQEEMPSTKLGQQYRPSTYQTVLASKVTCLDDIIVREVNQSFAQLGRRFVYIFFFFFLNLESGAEITPTGRGTSDRNTTR